LKSKSYNLNHKLLELNQNKTEVVPRKSTDDSINLNSNIELARNFKSPIRSH